MPNSIGTIALCALIAWIILGLVLIGPLIGKMLKIQRVRRYPLTPMAQWEIDALDDKFPRKDDDTIFKTVEVGRRDFR